VIAERLKNLRENSGLNQTQAAEKLGLSRVNYNRYENGEREPDNATLSRLADFFDVTTDDLLGRDKQDKVSEPQKTKDLEKFLDNQEIMFDGVPLTEDDKAKIRKSLEIIFWDAREKNKKARDAAKARREKEANERGTI
jgi:HTH-type transcriptional regulator, competence development regulator